MMYRSAGFLLFTLVQGCVGNRSVFADSPTAITIVEAGQSEYAIVIPADATPTETFASEELAKYLRQMSGAALKVQQGGNVPDAAIIVRDNTADKASRKGDPKPNGEVYTFHGEGRRLYIIGGDGRGTLRGVYAFLDALGCRFLAPEFDHYQGAAEVIPRRATITVTPTISNGTLQLAAGGLEAGAAPDLAYRKLYIEEGISHDETNLRQMIEWMPKAGYNVLVCPLDYGNKGRVRWDAWRDALTPELQKRGITIEVGGHGYENFLNAEMDGGKHFAKHPEWFGCDEKGTRRKGKAFVFCTSNPAAVEFVTNSFLGYVAKRPEIQIFDFWPPDGAKWCECEPCEALGEPPERQAKLLSHVSRAVATVRPDLKMEAIAYSKLIEPPKTETIDKNVLIDFCPIAQNFEFTIDNPAGHGMREDGVTPRANKQYFDALKSWRERFDGPISIYSYYRRYAWDSLPLVLPWHMKRELAYYATVPTQGISTYSEPGDWFAYELNHYVLAALAWDREQHVDALVKKFAAARYGESSPVVIETYQALAEIVRTYCSVPFVSLKSEIEIDAAAQRVDAIAKELGAARAAQKGVAIKRHLERLALVVEYVQRDLSVQKLRAAKAPREQVRARVAKDHAWLSEHSGDGFVLLKGHRLNLTRAYTRYGVNDKAPTTSPTE